MTFSSRCCYLKHWKKIQFVFLGLFAWYAPLKTKKHVICRFRAGSKTVRPALKTVTLMWSMWTVHWRSTSLSHWTVESTPASPPTTWGSRRTTCSWRLKVRHGSCHNSEGRDWTRGSTLNLFKDYDVDSLCYSVFQSPPASSSSQSTGWSREAWAPRSSVKSNTTRPSSPPWPGSKTTESYLTTRGANHLLGTMCKKNQKKTAVSLGEKREMHHPSLILCRQVSGGHRQSDHQRRDG